MTIFEFVKSNVSILDVVQEYVTLKPAGNYWKGHSPFHNEKTPSFTVSPHRNIYYCFSSSQGGDVISFIAKMENCSQLEAVQHLIERYNLEVPNHVDWKKLHDKENYKKNHEKVCHIFERWCHEHLMRSPQAQHYLIKRGVTIETIVKFSLGFCPPSYDGLNNLLTYAKNNNLLAQDFINAQLCMQGRKNLYIPFENRIIFPIRDNLGRPCGFGGRTFDPHDTRARYYNSHDHEYFNKSSIFFGLDAAKSAIQKNGSVYLVEGYMDCIVMVQSGYPNTIAVLGTSCTLEHLKIIARYTQKLIIIYDGDRAGKQAIVRLAQLCWQVNIELFVVTLPEQEDPASFLVKHKNLVQPLEKIQGIFPFFIEHLGTKFLNKTVPEKLATTKQLIEALSNLSDQMQQDILLHKAATTFDIPFEILKKSLHQVTPQSHTILNKLPQKLTEDNNNHDLSNNYQKEPISILEKKLFSAILFSETLLSKDDEFFLLEHLSPPLSALLKKFIQNQHNFATLFNNANEKEQQFMSQLSLEPYYHKPSLETLQKLFIEFQKKQWKIMLNDVKIKLAEARSNNSDEIKKILADFQKLKKTMLHRGLR